MHGFNTENYNVIIMMCVFDSLFAWEICIFSYSILFVSLCILFVAIGVHVGKRRLCISLFWCVCVSFLHVKTVYLHECMVVMFFMSAAPSSEALTRWASLVYYQFREGWQKEQANCSSVAYLRYRRTQNSHIEGSCRKGMRVLYTPSVTLLCWSSEA